jgi:hypothetical protein
MTDFDVSKDIIIDVVQRDINKFIDGAIIINVELSQQQPENKDSNTIFINITFKYNNTISTTSVIVSNNKI